MSLLTDHFRFEESLQVLDSDRLIVFLSMPHGARTIFNELTLYLDGKQLQKIQYSANELLKLQARAVQLFYVGRIGTGPHRLKLEVKTLQGHVRPMETYTFVKGKDNKVVELKIAGTPREIIVTDWPSILAPIAVRPEFANPVTWAYGKAQLAFIESILAAKAGLDPPKGLAASRRAATAFGERPPMDLDQLARDAEAVATLWLEYAGFLYGTGEYDLAGRALALSAESQPRARSERFESLQTRLALRGVVRLSEVRNSTDGARDLVLNRALLAGQKAAQSMPLFDRLKQIAADSNNPVQLRHRALIWASPLALDGAGNMTEAFRLLAQIPGDSPLLADALLVALRIDEGLSPEAISAVSRVLSEAAPESAAAWEARDRLVKVLLAKGAVSQAGQVALGEIAKIRRALDILGARIAEVGKSSARESVALLPWLQETERARAEALLARRENLLKARELLTAWRPHLESYFNRLENDPFVFADDIGRANGALIEDLRKSSAAGKDVRSEHLRITLGELFGEPSDKDTLRRLFFGLAQWEFDYEYPELWNPLPQQAADEQKPDLNRSERRRQQVRGKVPDESRLLRRAIDHGGKLLDKINQMAAKVPRTVYVGRAEAARALGVRNIAQTVEIDRLLGALEDGIKREILGGLKDRRRITQEWLNRFAFQVMTANAAFRPAAEEAHFDLDRNLVIKKGEPVIPLLAAIPSAETRKKGQEVGLLAAWEALLTATVDGETRQVRADALRMRAQLSAQLFEAQLIPSAEDAASHYRELLRNYGDLVTDRADVLYQLARAEDMAQHQDASLAALSEFANAYPNDPRGLEAAFRAGEIEFGLGEYLRARASYERVVRGENRRYAEQAEYKLAWTHFKLAEYEKALPRFVEVIDRFLAAARPDDGIQRERVKDAYRALSLVFSYLEGPSDVAGFFERHGTRPYVSDIYYNLATYYLEHDRINDAASTYRYLERLYPGDVRLPTLLAGTVKGARAERLSKLALELQEHFVVAFAPSGAYWERASPDVREQIKSEMKQLLAELAQMYHADAQQQNNSDFYAKAIRSYSQYVAMFPTDAQTPYLHFLMAEARMESGDLAGALLDYDKAAYQYGMHGKAAEAGYAALLANQKLSDLEQDPGEQRILLRSLGVRSARFASTFPGDTRVNAVLAKVAEDILKMGMAAESVLLQESLLARDPDAVMRRRASVSLAHAYFESAVFDKAEIAYKQALVFPDHPPAVVQELQNRLALSIYRRAEVLRNAGEATMAIETFLRVAKAVPGNEIIPNAEIDAVALLLAEKKWARAIEVLERFLNNFPNHKLAPDIPLKLAFAYEHEGRGLDAADLLDRLSQTETDSALAQQMLLRAAELRLKGERTESYVATMEAYLRRFPTPLEKATEVRHALADVATKAKDMVTRNRWLNELVTHAKVATDPSIRVRVLAAQASMVFGDDQATAFNAIRLTLPLDKSLPAKRQALESALRWYGDAGRYAIAEVTTAATFKTAEIYRRMAKDLMTSERPAGLNPLEVSQYNVLIEEEAGPFDDKATEFHELNYNRIQGGLYDEWVKRSMISLRSLLPSRFDRVEFPIGLFEYIPPRPVVKAVGTKVSPGNDNVQRANGHEK